jgi:hypothetical protein
MADETLAHERTERQAAADRAHLRAAEGSARAAEQRARLAALRARTDTAADPWNDARQRRDQPGRLLVRPDRIPWVPSS